jgi:uncharacterized protein YciI
MYFVLHAFDKAGALETRLANYAAHKAFLADTRRTGCRLSCLARSLPMTERP